MTIFEPSLESQEEPANTARFGEHGLWWLQMVGIWFFSKKCSTVMEV
jgi:hypothetical protein